jgi:hypothetical protein
MDIRLWDSLNSVGQRVIMSYQFEVSCKTILLNLIIEEVSHNEYDGYSMNNIRQCCNRVYHFDIDVQEISV